MQGICEYVLSAHKVKIFVPKEGVTFAFSPSGVRCPQRAQAAAAGRPAVEVRQLQCKHSQHPWAVGGAD